MMFGIGSYYRGTLFVAAFLGAQAVVTSIVANGNRTPLAQSLDSFPANLGHRWTMIREDKLNDQEAQVLRADQVLLRTYRTAVSAEDHDVAGESTAVAPINLLVAYFEAQVEGRAPHSPKNCLPGSGFVPVESSIVYVGEIPVNRYLLARDEYRILMLYWYQTGRRAIASEYAGKLFLVTDALLHRRTESTIVRVSVPLQHAGDTRTEKEALAFVRAVHPAVLAHLAK